VTRTSRGLAKTRPGQGLELVEVEIPEPGPGELLVRVRACGICGTDLGYYQWKPEVQGLIELPRVLGHEFIGRVEAIGPETSIAVGARVTADSDGGCGTCRFCRRGYPHACEQQSRLGHQRDGGLADYVLVPERSAHVLPPGMDERIACLLEPFAAAVHAVELLPNCAGTAGAVIGPGPIGLLAATALADAGCGPVLVAGLAEDDHRLEAARRLGFEGVTVEEAVASAQALGELGGADVVVDAVGSAASLTLAARLARFGGHIAIVGLGAAGHFAPLDLVSRELHVHGSWRRTPATWDRTITIAERNPQLASLVDGAYPLERFEEAFAALVARAHIKTVIEVGEPWR